MTLFSNFSGIFCVVKKVMQLIVLIVVTYLKLSNFFYKAEVSSYKVEVTTNWKTNSLWSQAIESLQRNYKTQISFAKLVSTLSNWILVAPYFQFFLLVSTSEIHFCNIPRKSNDDNSFSFGPLNFQLQSYTKIAKFATDAKYAIA